MNKSYLDINEVEKWTADKPNLYGFDKTKP